MSKLALLVWIASGTQAFASPAACIKSPKDMTREAKVIVVAKPTSASLVTARGTKTHRAVYAVTSVIRGAKTMTTVQVETSCRDEAIPERQLGYPGAQRYCPNHLFLPSFTPGTSKPDNTSPVLLFLSDASPAQLIDPTSYGACDDTKWPRSTTDTIALVKKLAGSSGSGLRGR